MIALAGIVLAFLWLMAETNWLRIRLLAGPDAPIISPELYQRLVALLMPPEIPAAILAAPIELEIPAPVITPKPVNTGPLLLAAQCQLTELQERLSGKYSDSWRYGTGYNTRRRSSYQEMHIGKVTIRLCATEPTIHKIIAEVTQAQFGKIRAATCTAKQLPLTFVESVRVGSHNEHVDTGGGHGYNRIVEDYETRFNDCLPGAAWLEAHHKDHADFQPAMDISVDGATKFVMTDSTYKATAVKDFMKQYKRGRGKQLAIEDPRQLVESEAM